MQQIFVPFEASVFYDKMKDLSSSCIRCVITTIPPQINIRAECPFRLFFLFLYRYCNFNLRNDSPFKGKKLKYSVDEIPSELRLKSSRYSVIGCDAEDKKLDPYNAFSFERRCEDWVSFELSRFPLPQI